MAGRHFGRHQERFQHVCDRSSIALASLDDIARKRVVVRTSSRDGPGDAHLETRALAGPRFNLKRASDEPDAFLDTSKTQPEVRTVTSDEANTIVGDPQLDASADGCQLHLNRPRARMAGGVGQRFLGDPKQAQRNVRMERVEIVRSGEGDLDCMMSPEVNAQTL